MQYIINIVITAGLMNKEYSDDYICTNFGKDVIKLLDEKIKDYYPSDNLVKNILVILRKTDSTLFELDKNTDKIKPGVYVFYKIKNNNYNGHTGFLFVDSKGNQIVLHNEINPKTKFNGVSQYSRPKNNFNNFFGKKEQKYNVYLKEIKIKR